MILDIFVKSEKMFPTFVIAEIGQNHQGDIEVAKKLIDVAKICGADCVKFQKTCLEEKFNKAALDREYTSENSWGATYGEHKQYLEFTEEEFIELQSYAHKLDVSFTASAMDLVSLRFLISIGVPFVKIGSGDANNFILIEEAARSMVPLVISTGMLSFETVKKIHATVSKYHTNFVLMHCISAYPTPLKDINLNVLTTYQTQFPDVNIGYSGHEMGVDITPIAVALGAKVIERHITLDHNQKGSDHKCSLNPNEFAEMVRKIRNVEIAIGVPQKSFQQSETPCYEKLGKTLVASKTLPRGTILKISDLNIKVAEPKGIDGKDIDAVCGKVLTADLSEDESIMIHHIE